MGLNHFPVLIILAVIALVIFGPKRLPELGHGLGKAITEFRKGTAELTHSHTVEVQQVVPATPVITEARAAAVPTEHQAPS